MENPNRSIRIATAGEALIDLIAQADGRFEPCLGGAVFNLTRASHAHRAPTTPSDQAGAVFGVAK